MAQNDPTNVFAAFEMLLEEIEVEIDLMNKTGATAFAGSDYKNAREILERADKATLLRDRLVMLRKEWEALMEAQQEKEEEEHIRVERRNSGRLQRGIRTPEKSYRQPILQALSEMGGRGRMNDVLIRVEQIMRGQLKQVDYEPLASDTELPRWRNTAQWERNSMVEEGYLKSNSQRGIWEISEKGRQAFTKGVL